MDAHWQWTEHQFAAAILLSQVACEMGARNAFTVLLVGRDSRRITQRYIPDFMAGCRFEIGAGALGGVGG